MTHQLRPAHQHPGNKAWFDTMYAMTEMGGKLITSAGSYKKTPTGWIPV